MPSISITLTGGNEGYPVDAPYGGQSHGPGESITGYPAFIPAGPPPTSITARLNYTTGDFFYDVTVSYRPPDPDVGPPYTAHIYEAFGYVPHRSGCTNPAAANYDPAADSDDDSCIFLPPGVDPTGWGPPNGWTFPPGWTPPEGWTVPPGEGWTHPGGGGDIGDPTGWVPPDGWTFPPGWGSPPGWTPPGDWTPPRTHGGWTDTTGGGSGGTATEVVGSTGGGTEVTRACAGGWADATHAC